MISKDNLSPDMRAQDAGHELHPIDARPSLQSRGFDILLRMLRLKKQWASADTVQARVRQLSQRPASYQPSGLGRGIDVTLRNTAGWPVYHTKPITRSDVCHHAVFLHGGGYIHEIVRPHWRFVADLTRHAPIRCVVPIYPLAPRTTANDLVPATGVFLRELLETAGAEHVTVIGNSSGAGLALAAVQWLRDSGCVKQPKALVLISPWLDASMSSPEQAAIAARDPMQDVPGLAETARLYAGNLDINHPFVSPLNGDLDGLPPMTVFTGTNDLLYPDSVALAKKVRQRGGPIEIYVQKGLPHNYALLPTPEGRQARATIASLCSEPDQ